MSLTFILSKILWIFVSPENFFILLMLVGGFLCMSHHERRQKFGRVLCFNVALFLFFVCILPVGNWMLTPLENAFPAHVPERVDGIILLGGDEEAHLSELRGQPVVLDSARRYIMFATLARQYPNAKLVYTGGESRLVPEAKMMDVAEVARTSLAGLGVPTDQMVFEDKSHNTHENAKFTAEIVHPVADQNWLLVTSAFHMPRSMACFRHEGWNVYPATAGYMTGGDLSSKIQFNGADHLREMAIAAHEYYGLIAYRLLGYTDSLWPK